MNGDPQDPLPENDWFWRRTYTFVMTLASLGFIWFGVEALYSMARPELLYSITRYMIGILFVQILFYMVAPSAEQIVKLIQAAKIIRSGIPTSQREVVETPRKRTERKTVTGRPDTDDDTPDEAPWA